MDFMVGRTLISVRRFDRRNGEFFPSFQFSILIHAIKHMLFFCIYDINRIERVNVDLLAVANRLSNQQMQMPQYMSPI